MRLGKILLVTAVFFILGELIHFLLNVGILYSGVFDTTKVSLVLTGFATSILVLLLVYLFLAKEYGQVLRIDSKFGIKEVVIPIALALICVILVKKPLFNDQGFFYLSSNDFKGLTLLSTIKGVLIGPIAEELIFRGYVFKELKKLTHWISALTFSSLLFSVFHFRAVMNFDPTFLIFAFFVGVVSAILYKWKESVSLPIIFHMAINFF